MHIDNMISSLNACDTLCSRSLFYCIYGTTFPFRSAATFVIHLEVNGGYKFISGESPLPQIETSAKLSYFCKTSSKKGANVR